MNDGKEEEGDEQEVAPVKHLKQKSGILAGSQIYTEQYRIELSSKQAEPDTDNKPDTDTSA